MPPEREEMAREFYGEVLGLTELEGRQDGLWYELENGQLLFLAPDRDFVPSHLMHPVFRVRNKEEALARFAEFMFEVEWPTDAEPAAAFYVYDPFGNRIAFEHRPRGG
jgi:catechol-2,3-dioxygenase